MCAHACHIPRGPPVPQRMYIQESVTHPSSFYPEPTPVLKVLKVTTFIGLWLNLLVSFCSDEWIHVYFLIPPSFLHSKECTTDTVVHVAFLPIHPSVEVCPVVFLLQLHGTLLCPGTVSAVGSSGFPVSHGYKQCCDD